MTHSGREGESEKIVNIKTQKSEELLKTRTKISM